MLEQEQSFFGWRTASCVTLVFLFVLLTPTLRHAAGAIYAILFCLSLTYLPWRTSVFSVTEQKLLCLIVFLLFLAGLGSSLANGWHDNALKGLGVQARYVAFIPIFLMLSTLPNLAKYFWSGLVTGAFVLFLYCSYELWFLGADRVYGPYKSPGLVGLLALIYSTVLLFAAMNPKATRVPSWLLWAAFASAVLSLALSGSRSVFITTVAMSLVMLSLQSSARSRPVSLVILGALTLALSLSEVGARQVFSAAQELASNFAAHGEGGSVSQRLDMWAVSLSIFMDHPIWGVGWRNFAAHASPFISMELRHPVLAAAPHPHNAYLNAAVTGGSVGLLTFVLVLVVPYLIAARWQEESPFYSAIARAVLLVFAINSLTEGGTLIYNNTASIYFFLLAVLFALMFKERVG